LAEDRRAGLARAVTSTELIGNVEVESADVCEREARVFEILEHFELDVTGEEIFVGAARFEVAGAFRQEIAGTKMSS